MSRAKVAISLDKATLERLDRLVEEEVFPNRSQAIEEAVSEKLERPHLTQRVRCGRSFVSIGFRASSKAARPTGAQIT